MPMFERRQDDDGLRSGGRSPHSGDSSRANGRRTSDRYREADRQREDRHRGQTPPPVRKR